MSSDDHKGIANILNLPVRNPVRNPKVEPQEDPIMTLSETLIRMKPLSLPKNETKEDYKYNDKNPIHRRELNKYLARNNSNSDGAWPAFVKASTDPNRPKHTEPVEYMEKMKNKHGSYSNYTKDIIKFGVENSSVPVSKAPQGSEQHRKEVLNYIEKKQRMYDGPKYVGNRSDNPSWMKDLEKTGPYGKNKRFVNKTLNKFENRTDNKDVVTFDPTTQLFTDETRNIAFKDYHKAKRQNDAVNGQPTATPEQVNYLKSSLDNARAYGYDPKDKKEDVRKTESTTNKHKRYI